MYSGPGNCGKTGVPRKRKRHTKKTGKK